MSLRILIFGLVVMTCGCGTREKQRLVGTWKSVEVEDLVSQVADKVQIDDWIKSDKLRDAAGAVANQIGDSIGSLQVIFRQDGTLETITDFPGINSTKKGTWKWISYNGPDSTAEIECNLNGQTTEHKIKFLEGNMIEFSPPNLAGLDRAMKFKKK